LIDRPETPPLQSADANSFKQDFSIVESLSEKSIIYVLKRADHDEISKVGSTKISAQSRAQNYTDGDWTVFFEITVPSVVQFIVERFAHDILKKNGYWLDPKITGGSATEVFFCEPEIAMSAVENAWIKTREETLVQLGVSKEVIPFLNFTF